MSSRPVEIVASLLSSPNSCERVRNWREKLQVSHPRRKTHPTMDTFSDTESSFRYKTTSDTGPRKLYQLVQDIVGHSIDIHVLLHLP